MGTAGVGIHFEVIVKETDLAIVLNLIGSDKRVVWKGKVELGEGSEAIYPARRSEAVERHRNLEGCGGPTSSLLQLHTTASTVSSPCMSHGSFAPAKPCRRLPLECHLVAPQHTVEGDPPPYPTFHVEGPHADASFDFSPPCLPFDRNGMALRRVYAS